MARSCGNEERWDDGESGLEDAMIAYQGYRESACEKKICNVRRKERLLTTEQPRVSNSLSLEKKKKRIIWSFRVISITPYQNAAKHT